MTDETESDDELSFAEVIDFIVERVEEEDQDFPGDAPKSAGTLINQNVADLLVTLSNIDYVRAHEEAEDPTDEEVREVLVKDAIDILMGVGALKAEYDLDLESAFRKRRKQMERIESAETTDELMEAIIEDDDLDDEMVEQLGLTGPPEPGDDVTADDYEADDPDRHIH